MEASSQGGSVRPRPLVSRSQWCKHHQIHSGVKNKFNKGRPSMKAIPAVKLKRTDTTLDQSQKAWGILSLQIQRAYISISLVRICGIFHLLKVTFKPIRSSLKCWAGWLGFNPWTNLCKRTYIAEWGWLSSFSHHSNVGRKGRERW